MATASDIITAALNKVGVYVPTTAQQATALQSLNNMISSWGADLIQPYQTRESFSLTVGTASYTIGTGGTFSATRPMRIESCFLRNSDGYDFPVDIMSKKDYDAISSKSFSARPEKVILLTEYPLAYIIFDNAPDVAYTAYFDFTKQFTEFSTVSDSVSLPSEYKEALVYNLAISCAEDWDRKVSQTVLLRARETKVMILALNASNQPCPIASFDIRTGSRYNINIDQ
jgi:hypothetical protein